MTRRIAIVFAACLLLSPLAFAQGAAGVPTPPDKAMLQKILDGWASMDTKNVIQYYDQAPDLAFYDVSPLKYDGFKAYMAGATKMFATLSSLKFTLNDDAAVHTSGDIAWTTATVKMVMTEKGATPVDLESRWTTIWKKQAGRWLIVHDHFSAAQEPPK